MYFDVCTSKLAAIKLRNMKHYRLIIGIIISQALFCSCDENDNASQKFNYSYEHITSNLNEIVNCVCFIDNETGFAANSGKIFKTIDSGVNWSVDSLTNLPINSIYFVNNSIGFAVGGESKCGGTGCVVPGSIVYKTSNSGNTWIKKTIPYKWSELNSVFFIDENIGFAIGLGLQIKTIDGGETWEEFEFEYKGYMAKILFIDSQIGFAAGLYGNVFKTTDQGNSWIKTNNESDGHIYDFCFPNKKTGYACGQKKIVKTTDGGNSWEVLKNSPIEMYYIHFADENNGIAIGKGHYTGGDWGTWTNAIYSTYDGGETWKMEDNINFGSTTSFPSNTKGFSVARNSTFKITIE